jgi:CTP:molybdopterin cytidylyltransferase MocA
MRKIHGLILAAGMSRRMKEFKPLMPIGDRTMIRWTIDGMLDAGVGAAVLVLGYRGAELEAHLSGLPQYDGKLTFVYNQAYEHTEMLDSVKLGIPRLGDCDGFFLVPGDMPAIRSETYRMLMEAKEHTSARVIFPTLDGFRKHPPLIDRSCADDILRFRGQGGLRELWQQYGDELLEVPIADRGCGMDADERADYERLCRFLAEQI